MDDRRGEQSGFAPVGDAGSDGSPSAAAATEIGVAPDELVVGLPQWRLVAAALHALGVWPAGTGPAAQDEQLGLALLTGFTDLAAAAGRVRADHRAEIAALEQVAGRPYEPIDVLLFELRRGFREQLAGYVPPLGKSRTGFLVAGWPYPKGMLAATFPERLDDPPPRPTVDPRLGAGVRVGVLDTPMSAHPDLAGRYLTVLPDDLLGTGSHSYRAGHGTFVADLIRRQAPAVQLETYGLLDSETGRSTLWDTALAICQLGNAGVDVLNLSLGCLTGDGEPPLLLQRALDRVDPEVVVVAAAGNHGRADHATVSPAWPAALDRVVAVGATGADFSADGPWVTCTAPGELLAAAYLFDEVTLSEQIRLASPAADPAGRPAAQVGVDPQQDTLIPTAGVDVTRRFTGYAAWSGTSFAAAWVSGAIAARTVPGRVSSREALAQLLAEPGSAVRVVDFQPPR
ncbi:MAG: hypothetical protein V7637_1370 [Mycobacteriales bacterium]